MISYRIKVLSFIIKGEEQKSNEKRIQSERKTGTEWIGGFILMYPGIFSSVAE